MGFGQLMGQIIISAQPLLPASSGHIPASPAKTTSPSLPRSGPWKPRLFRRAPPPRCPGRGRAMDTGCWLFGGEFEDSVFEERPKRRSGPPAFYCAKLCEPQVRSWGLFDSSGTPGLALRESPARPPARTQTLAGSSAHRLPAVPHPTRGSGLPRPHSGSLGENPRVVSSLTPTWHLAGLAVAGWTNAPALKSPVPPICLHYSYSRAVRPPRTVKSGIPTRPSLFSELPLPVPTLRCYIRFSRHILNVTSSRKSFPISSSSQIFSSLAPFPLFSFYLKHLSVFSCSPETRSAK